MSDLVRLWAFLLRISRNIHGSRRSMAFSVAAGLLAGLGNTALIALVNQRIGGRGSAPSWLGASFLALLMLVPLSRFASQYLLVSLGARSTFDLRLGLCHQILGSPLRRLEEIGPPKLIAHLTEDFGAIGQALVQVPLLCMQLAVVVGCLAYMAYLSWRLFLVVVLGLVLGAVSYQLPLLRSLSYFRASRERWDELLRHFEGLTFGIKELKLHSRRRESFVEKLYRPAAEDIRDLSIRGNAVLTAANSWGHILFFAVIGLVVFVIGQRTALPEHVLVGYALTLLFMMSPLEVVLNTLPNMSRAKVAAERIEGLAKDLSEGVEEEWRASEVARPTWQELRFEGVTHTFHQPSVEDEFLLGPIDLALRPGEIVFLVGGNGSGKTTLAKLLVGLYEPEQGRILLDGAPVTTETRESYRHLFSAVFTSFYLFDRLLGLEMPDLDGKARAHLAELQLSQKVQVRDGVFSTVALSQGQRKRLALLVAYIEDRPIYLFDEWAADQDPHFKEVFYRRLLPDLRARGNTAVVISHDDRYYEVADRIIKLDYGRIVAETAAVTTVRSSRCVDG